METLTKRPRGGLTRSDIAATLAAECVALGLNDAYGCAIDPPNPDVGRNYYTVLFCKARILDGSIRIWGRTSISVRWQTAIRDLPRNGQVWCANVAGAVKVLRDNFGGYENGN